MKKFIFIFIAILLVSLLLLQIDDDLDAQSIALAEKTEVYGESEAYFLLNGIFAHSDESPIELGKKLLKVVPKTRSRRFLFHF